MTNAKREAYEPPTVRRVSLAGGELAAAACKTTLVSTAFGPACKKGSTFVVKTAGS